MAGWMAAAAALEGQDPLAPLRPMGDAFSESPGRGAPARLAFGLALHLAFAAAVGVLFTALLPADLEGKNAAVMSVGFTFLVMAIMTSWVLPAVNPSLRAEMPELGGSWVLAHVAYGVVVGYAAQALRQRGAARTRTPLPAARPRTA
jgi:hypothetical protein